MRITKRVLVCTSVSAALALMSFGTQAAPAETGLLGVKLRATFADVMKKLGQPNRIEPGEGTQSAGETTTTPGAAAGSAGMMAGVPGMMLGAPGPGGMAGPGMPGGGGRPMMAGMPSMGSGGMSMGGAMLPGLPSMGGMAPGMPSMPSGGGSSMGMMMGLAGGPGMPSMSTGGGMSGPGMPGGGRMRGGMSGGMTGPGGMMSGMMGGLPMPGGMSSGMPGPGSMIPGLGASGPGMMGGAEGMAAGGGSAGDTGEVTWVYEKGPATTKILFDKEGRVIQIQAYGYSGVATAAGKVSLGDAYDKILRIYGWPESPSNEGGNIIARYPKRSNVAFQMSEKTKTKGMRVVAITVALTEKDEKK